MAAPVPVWGVNETLGPPRRTRSEAEEREIWTAIGSFGFIVFLVILNVISFFVSLLFWPTTNPWDDTRIGITTAVGAGVALVVSLAILALKVMVIVPLLAARSTNE